MVSCYLQNLLEVVEEQRNQELSDNQNILPNIDGTNQNYETGIIFPNYLYSLIDVMSFYFCYMVWLFYIQWILDESTVPQNLIPEEPDMIFAENSNNDQSEFDTIVGCIEDIVIGEKFQDLQV